MFRMLNAATALLPQTGLGPLWCEDWYSACWGGSGLCYWPSRTVTVGCLALTTRTVFEQGVACLAATSPDPGQVTPSGDPVEQLQALRRQLEIALAGVQAQEKIALEQQQAALARTQAEKK